MLRALSILPEDARPQPADSFKAPKKNLSLPQMELTRVRVSVWIKQSSFYVSNVVSMPAAPSSDLLTNKTANKQGGVQLNYDQTKQSARLAWAAVVGLIEHMNEDSRYRGCFSAKGWGLS